MFGSIEGYFVSYQIITSGYITLEAPCECRHVKYNITIYYKYWQVPA